MQQTPPHLSSELVETLADCKRLLVAQYGDRPSLTTPSAIAIFHPSPKSQPIYNESILVPQPP